MITPMSFDHETSREVTGEEQGRLIEAKARKDAAAKTFDPPVPVFSATTYFSRVQNAMRSVVYRVQYEKSLARDARKTMKIKAPEAP